MNEYYLSMQEDMLNSIVFAASNNTYNLHYHQDTKETSTREFHKAIIKDVNTHIKQKQ